ncbi:MAG: iron-sulfur cluster-binding domain-containing protein, partial [Rhodoferax sp.]|nr:iron-sulfur cluster-binding domain-containing protein [Rhodoferax sp.]
VYCTRDADHTAFLDELGAARFAGRVLLHHDQGDPNEALDLWPLLETPGTAQVYCWGPRGLMEAVADMTGHWPSGSIHFESFGADAAVRASNSAFAVRLHRAGTVLSVGADQTILEVLRAHGHKVVSSCESGTCGSCRTGLLGGDADHRDMVLDEGEKSSQIMVCVSRARAGELVLDL